MAAKQSWEGRFNINNEDQTSSTRAYSAEQAMICMARNIARRKGVPPRAVLNYLRQHPHSYEINIKR